MQPADDFATSLEFRYLVDRTLAARQAGHRDVADTFARAAQGLLEARMPDLAHDVSKIASRKGEGCAVASKLALRLTPTAGAAIFVVWSCRGARRTATDALSNAFRRDPAFDQTVRLLCARAFTPTTAVAPPAPMSTTAIEVASSHRY